MAYAFHTLDVFTDRPFGGNPLAVVPDAEGLLPAQMQAVAAEFNLSETVFLLPPSRPGAARRARIFTPRMELPFAGHPTIGAALLLARLEKLDVDAAGAEFVLEEQAGDVRVRVSRPPAAAAPVATLDVPVEPELRAPERTPPELAGVVGLTPEDLRPDWQTLAVSCGVPYLILPVKDADALGRARVDEPAWRELLAAAWAPHVYVVAPGTGAAAADFRTRMFAPAMGIAEDPATGAAAAALAAYLWARRPAGAGPSRWSIAQGIEMGRPSRIDIEVGAAGEGSAGIRVGGSAVLIASGILHALPARA